MHSACVPCGRGVVVDHLHWRQTLSLRRKCCSRHAFSQRYTRFHDEVQRVASTECQVVLSGCTIMFQGNFESSPSFPIFLHNPNAGTVCFIEVTVSKQLDIKTAKGPQPLANSPSLVLKRTLDQNLSSGSTLVTLTTHSVPFRRCCALLVYELDEHFDVQG